MLEHQKFSDPDWDGDLSEPIIIDGDNPLPPKTDEEDEDDDEIVVDPPPRQRIIIQLNEEREMTIKSMMTSTFFYNGEQIKLLDG